ncbi:NEW3 domain-containing protein [Actinoallomurus acaciae]|uniref:NEW3 domain-containing protein n=1 Tax=Actinoallomurus acaciae TaxID=502577 RepID=A0ABV5YMC3_9ACTN
MRTLTVTTLAAAGLLCLAPDAGATRAGSHLTVTGQASHLRPTVGEVETVRWTVTNTGDGHLDHVRLTASVPTGWTVKDGPGCTHVAANLRCELGGLDAGRRVSVDVPMVVRKPLGAVQLHAWAVGSVGRLTVPGPETSFQVIVVGRR